MNGISAPVPADDPRMIAWKAHQKTPEYANTFKWAMDPPCHLRREGDRKRRQQNVEGTLWASFIAGFEGRTQLPGQDDES